jgi:nucleoside recognition membrane protein YjiH
MDVNQISTAALRAFALVGIAAAFLPALARNRARLGVTFVAALLAVAILWSN